MILALIAFLIGMALYIVKVNNILVIEDWMIYSMFFISGANLLLSLITSIILKIKSKRRRRK